MRLVLQAAALSRAIRHANATSAAPAVFLHAKRWYASRDGMIDYSIVPTMHYQKSLPRLPVPKLEETLDKYLEVVEPVLNASELEATQEAVQDFKEAAGPLLHKQVADTDKVNKHTSYIAEPWFDMYLKSRTPLPLNYNPFLTFKPHETEKARDEPVNRAASLVYSAVRFQNALEARRLPPDVYHTKPQTSDTKWFKNLVRLVPDSISWYCAYLVGAYPLDMSQYGCLFGTERVPRVGKDELVTNPSPNHIVVMRCGKFYKLRVRDIDGNPVALNDLRDAMAEIVKDTVKEEDNALGLLTTTERDRWARLRAEIVKDDTNRQTIKDIDSASFLVCLDTENAEKETDLTRQMLHGNGRNRWFDKSFSLIVTNNGYSGLNFEHSWGDGVAVLRFFNDVHQDTLKTPLPQPGSGTHLPEKLQLNLSPEVKAAVKECGAEFDRVTSSMDVNFTLRDDFGKNLVKKAKMSPDGVAQMAIQLAYHRLSGGKTAATYESCTQAAFKHGRTETVRPASNASVEMCRVFADANSSKEAKKAALEKAQAAHGKSVLAAATGKGVDRILFAMRTLAERKGMETPAIFKDEAYKRVNHIILSTSTLSSPNLVMGGFGPVTEDGFGIGYVIEDDRTGFNVTSYNVEQTTQFLKHLDDSLTEIKDILA